MCGYVHRHASLHDDAHKCACTLTHASHAHTHVSCEHACAREHAHTHAVMHLHMHVCMPTWCTHLHACTYARAYARAHARTRVCVTCKDGGGAMAPAPAIAAMPGIHLDAHISSTSPLHAWWQKQSMPWASCEHAMGHSTQMPPPQAEVRGRESGVIATSADLFLPDTSEHADGEHGACRRRAWGDPAAELSVPGGRLVSIPDDPAAPPPPPPPPPPLLSPPPRFHV